MSLSFGTARSWAAAAVVFVAVAGATAAGLAVHAPGASHAAPAAGGCPAGYALRDPQELAREYNPAYAQVHARDIQARYGKSVCVKEALLPESMMDVSERMADVLGTLGLVPDGAPRRAVEQKAALAAAAATVPNSGGHWQAYGTAPQVDDPAYYNAIPDEGLHQVSGRVDNFSYDPVAKRLFAAVGNGGIWYSQAASGDVSTLGDHWVSISDKLPTLINSAVAWTKAQNGRVLALTGEMTQGGNSYIGLGAYWSGDLGKTWNHATGVPDGAFAFKLAVDQSNPNIVYAATGKGLYRSVDAGASYVNVKLPVSSNCAGVSTGVCQFANFVTDVVVQQPGGVSNTACGAKGCAVLAAVGFRAGAAPYASDSSPQAPGNGLYRSATGEAGTFASVGLSQVTGLEPVGLPVQWRIGRTVLGNAIGDGQDHGYVYAMIQDAGYLNGDLPMLDADLEIKNPGLPDVCDQVVAPIVDQSTADTCKLVASHAPSATTLNGVFVSPDFGSTWVRLADDKSITYNPATQSALTPVIALGVGPGIQSWYNSWIKPDPTQADPALGVPTRLTFGLEELWKSRLNVPQNGVSQLDYKVFGAYFAGQTCLFLLGQPGITPGMPVCPTYDGIVNGSTTHPDQHDGIYIPDGSGGVWLFVGNDGGIYKQHSSDPVTDDLANNKWGDGVNNERYTFMVYGIAVAKDGTVYYGLQDNASGKIDPKTHVSTRIGVGDGVWTAVDPDNSQHAYISTPELAVVSTADGGLTQSNIEPSSALVGTAHFLSPYMLDPTDPTHIVLAGSKVAESLKGLNTTSSDSDWNMSYDLGSDASGALHTSRSRMLDVQGAAIYAAWCGPCNLAGSDVPFQRGIATNVGGSGTPKKGASDNWHQAGMAGLPNRYIYSVKMDPQDTKTVYATLGGYSTARWAAPGQYGDKNANIGKGHVFVSHDAAEHFSDISGDLPDTVVSFLVRRGSQLVVGTDIGAFISSDLTGAHWAPLGDLASVPINQLVLKPGDDSKLFAATFGRGVQLYDFSTANSGGGSSSSSGGGSSSSSSSSGGTSSSSSSSSSGGTSGGGSSSSSGGSSSSSGGGSQPPVASLQATPTSGTAPLAVSFDASGSSDPNSGGKITTYAFNFGDGSSTSQTTAKVSHTYTKTGSFDAVVTVTDSEGGSASRAVAIQVQSPPADSPNPSLAASPTNGTAPLAVNFDASGSTDANGSITGYSFDFGDGSAAVSQKTATTSHTYNAAGNFTASVTVTNSFGNKSSAYVAIQVGTSVVVTPPSGPVAELELKNNSGPAPLTVQLIGTNSYERNSTAHITSYTFDFGDGSAPLTQSGSTTTHTYTSPGTYFPSLTVRDSSGAQSTITAKAVAGPADGSGGGTGTSSGSSGGGAFAPGLLLPLLLGAALRRRRNRRD